MSVFDSNLPHACELTRDLPGARGQYSLSLPISQWPVKKWNSMPQLWENNRVDANGGGYPKVVVQELIG